MTFWHGFWIITGVHFLACMSPGPDFVLVSQQALSRGRAAGMLTALGIALGFGIHIIYSVLGLVTLVAQSAPLLTAVKIVGGLYLLYIGYKGLRAKAAGGTVEIRKDHLADEPTWKTIWRGVLCNVGDGLFHNISSFVVFKDDRSSETGFRRRLLSLN